MSIYDSIGGAAAVRAAVDDFYDRVLADPELAPFFDGTDMRRLKAHQRSFVAAAIGGPELAVFDAASGVSLVDAVAASSAVPGVWPPVTIDGRRYMDGGVRSADNADLAAGAQRIIVVSPLGLNSPLPSPMPLREVLTRLKKGGATVTVISPDETSAAAIGTNALDPATRVPAAMAGRAQGRAGLPPVF
jgi:NTE family protein